MIQSRTSIASSEVAAHYNSLDQFYRQIWGEHVHHGYWETGDESIEEAVLHLSRSLAGWLQVKEGDAVCDVGCGYGGTSRFLAEEWGLRVTGLTISEAQHRFASEKPVSRGSVRFLCQDFLRNDFAHDSFDGILSIECIEHIEDKAAVFAEAYRLLKPGKRMALALWSACERPNRLEAHVLEAICREGRIPSLLAGSEYEAVMQGAGFRIIEAREIGDQVKKTWSICGRRLAYRLATDSRYRAFLLDPESRDKIFALTLFRIMAAFQTRTMRYWIYAIENPL